DRLPIYFHMLRDSIVFAGLVFLFWALPVHSAARLAVNKRDWLKRKDGGALDLATEKKLLARYELPGRVMPRVLGVLCFIAVLAGLAKAVLNLFSGQTNEIATHAILGFALFALFAVIFASIFVYYFTHRRELFNARFGAIFGKVPNAPHVGRNGSNPRLLRGSRVESWVLNSLFAVLVLVLAAPWLLDIAFPRLFLLPLLLGVWVPALAWLGRRSHAIRAPMIALAIAALALIAYIAGNSHDVRRMETDEPVQLKLADAVDAWKKANNCLGAVRNCPSPIIVAAAGGASRAAFHTASALGLMLDATCISSATPELDRPPLTASEPSPGTNFERCREQPTFARRLFAISSVSGSSLAAAVFARAAHDGTMADGSMKPPCRNEASTLLWFGGDKPGHWRGCLQAILADDFLSPVFAGLAFRDVFSFVGAFLPEFWKDRGRRLEDSWSHAYRRFVQEASVAKAALDEGFGAVGPAASGHHWRPVLLLNSTHVESGKRVIASHLSPCYVRPEEPGIGPVRLFSDAYDLHELLAGRAHASCAAGGIENAKRTDAPLTAAAHNSARFPLVSPAGNVRDANGRIAARLVDGGYFENYGAVAAYDLADVLRYDFQLFPFVVLITNDPADAQNVDEDPDRWIASGPRPIEANQRRALGVFTAPIDTFFATRSARGSTAVRKLRELLDARVNSDSDHEHCKECAPEDLRNVAQAVRAPTCRAGDLPRRANAETCFAHISVPGEDGRVGVKEVSMSWWLSKPVQEFLDDQLLCGNDVALDLICSVATREGRNPATDEGRANLCRKKIVDLGLASCSRARMSPQALQR
ncbi:MAG: hypothetical protein ABWZ80_01630, partial [Beijerinckiaceae bacterium]